MQLGPNTIRLSEPVYILLSFQWLNRPYTIRTLIYYHSKFQVSLPSRAGCQTSEKADTVFRRSSTQLYKSSIDILSLESQQQSPTYIVVITMFANSRITLLWTFSILTLLALAVSHEPYQSLTPSVDQDCPGYCSDPTFCEFLCDDGCCV